MDSTSAETLAFSDEKLLRDVCRYFVPALMALVNERLADLFDIDMRQILSPECYGSIRDDVQFKHCLVLRFPLTEERYREEVRSALAKHKLWQREEAEDDDSYDEEDDYDEDDSYDDEDEEEIEVTDEEIDEAILSGEALNEYRVHSMIVVPVIFLGDDEIDDETAERLFHYSAHFQVEDHVRSFPHPVFLKQGPAGSGDCRYEQKAMGFTTMSFQCPAFGLQGAQAADWLDRLGETVQTATALFSPLMTGDDWPPEEREEQLRSAISKAPVDEGRRRMLGLLLDRQLQPSPDVDQEIQRLLYEAPSMPEPNIASFKILIRTFFGDLLTIIGRFAVKGLDFQRVQLHDNLPECLQGGLDEDLGGAPFLEMTADVGRRGHDEDALVYLFLSDDREEETDEQLARRYMRLRLDHPGRVVIPIALFMGNSTGDHCTICQRSDRNGDEILNRFRYYAFSINANNPEDYLEDPRPVAWALASMMSSWHWSRGKVVMESLMKILQASDIDIDSRQALWQFARANMSVDDDDREIIEEKLVEHATLMRETVDEYLEKRLGRFFPQDLRDSLSQEDDPMKVHQLIEAVYEASVEQGLIPRDAMPASWPIN